jgi:uncharacterized membrane protein YoaK (UPF0700 family)
MTQLTPLLSPEIVHDRDRLGIWLALTFAAGAVNAAALAACKRFVSHVTGTLTHIGADYDHVGLMAEYSLVLVFFVLGAMTSGLLVDGRRLRGSRPRPVLPLVLVAVVLLGAAVGGCLGLFGRFGEGIETTAEFGLLCVLALAMGLQNAAVATTTGMIVRTTHLTGPLTDFSIALATMMGPGPSALILGARRSAALRGAKIVAFVVGCFVSSFLAPALGFALFLLPAGAVCWAAAMLHRTLRHHARDDEAPRSATTLLAVREPPR